MDLFETTTMISDFEITKFSDNHYRIDKIIDKAEWIKSYAGSLVFYKNEWELSIDIIITIIDLQKIIDFTKSLNGGKINVH